MKIKDLSNQQAVLYNQMIADFQKDFNYGGFQRLGQAFINFYWGTIFTEPYPKLFYCEDNKRTMKMIEISLVDYVMGETE